MRNAQSLGLCFLHILCSEGQDHIFFIQDLILCSCESACPCSGGSVGSIHLVPFPVALDLVPKLARAQSMVELAPHPHILLLSLLTFPNPASGPKQLIFAASPSVVQASLSALWTTGPLAPANQLL